MYHQVSRYPKVATNQKLEDDDNVPVEYNGKQYLIPRSDYKRRLTTEEINKVNQGSQEQLKQCPVVSPWKEESYVQKSTNRSNPQQGPTHSEYPELFLDNLEREFRRSMELSSKARISSSAYHKDCYNDNVAKRNPLLKEQESSHSCLTCPSSNRLGTKKKSSLNTNNWQESSTEKATGMTINNSTESIETEKSTTEVKDKLQELKSKVANLIDETISQIEFQGRSSNIEMLEQPSAIHPDGDGFQRQDLPNRSEINMTPSKLQEQERRRAMRQQLYNEIGTVLKRLQDIELL
ncbi:uncharacterized protein LOC129749675 [Uranotaenia lowii]|uniref:uncharacterized protein LOC129749675 n=1 Tax=Uranotaenia lowii TaxID=190385 RepID=UPI0024790D12|nr:uncharacterized protein LOC129749675 [Uranotaenia lowii]